MQEIGKIVEANGRHAVVEVQRKSACDGCHRHAEGCTACSIFIGNAKHRVSVDNRIGAAVGDKVLLEATTQRVLSYALLVFVLPLIVACVFYGVSALFFFSEELPCIGIAALGMALTYFIVSKVSLKLESKNKSVFIARILTPSDELFTEMPDSDEEDED